MLRNEKRPLEISNLFNPAFCALIIGNALRGYYKQRNTGMPFELVYTVLPIILHKSTREALPNKISTKFHVWIQDKQYLKIDFANRAKEMVPFTKEALILGMNAGFICLDVHNFMSVAMSPSKTAPSNDNEVVECLKKAEFLGRWLGQAGDITTIFMMWGIKP